MAASKKRADRKQTEANNANLREQEIENKAKQAEDYFNAHKDEIKKQEEKWQKEEQEEDKKILKEEEDGIKLRANPPSDDTELNKIIQGQIVDIEKVLAK